MTELRVAVLLTRDFDEPQTHLLFFGQISTFMSKTKRTGKKLKRKKTKQGNIPLL
jgi:hypothetical protein